MIWFLVAVMLFTAPDGQVTVRRVFLPVTDAVTCERAAKAVNEEWHKEKPLATLLVECVPVRTNKFS